MSKLMYFGVILLVLCLSIHSSQASDLKYKNFQDEEESLILVDPKRGKHLGSEAKITQEEDLILLDSTSSPLSKRILEEQPLLINDMSLAGAYKSAFVNEEETKLSGYMKFKYIISFIGAIGPIIPQIARGIFIGRARNKRGKF